MGEGEGRGSDRVGSDFLSAIAGRVGSTFRRVGLGPRKVTRGQLCYNNDNDDEDDDEDDDDDDDDDDDNNKSYNNDDDNNNR